jgi:polysaccharide export outer membrane protein
VKLTNIFLAGFLMLPGSFWAQEAAAPEAKFLPPGLAPGDQIDVRMFDFPDLGSGALHLHVSGDGTLHLPYAGTIKVSGMTGPELEHAVEDALVSRGMVKQANVSVDVVSAVNMLVQVLGEVKTPRALPLYAPAPISYVMGQVGGITGLASHQLTIVHHSDQPPTTLDYDPDSPSLATLNTMIQPGDIVNVSKLGVYFVSGEVNRPGIFPLGGALSIGQASSNTGGIGVVNNITLLQALSQAGGITQIARRSKMHILRTVNGKREEIVVDQLKLSNGEIADPIIHAGDIIYVPSSYIRLQTNNLFSTAISSIYAANELKTY